MRSVWVPFSSVTKVSQPSCLRKFITLSAGTKPCLWITPTDVTLSGHTEIHTTHGNAHSYKVHILGLNIHYQCARVIPDMHWEKAFSFSVWVDYNLITPLFWRAVDNTGTPEGQEDLEKKYRMFIPAQTVNDVSSQRARYALFCVSWFVANTVQGHGWAEQTVERCITFVSLAVVLAQH